MKMENMETAQNISTAWLYLFTVYFKMLIVLPAVYR
jgi:hypothetical protein